MFLTYGGDKDNFFSISVALVHPANGAARSSQTELR